MELAFKLT